MSNQESAGATAQTALTPLKRFNATIKDIRTQDYLLAVLGEKKESFVTNVTTLVANNALLQNCNPMGVIYAAMKATALDLPLEQNLGLAYVIPYKNNKTGEYEAQFQIGAKGLKQLALRSGQFVKFNVTDVREGELSGYNLLTGDFCLKAVPNRQAVKVVGYAAYFKLVNGFSKSLYMTVEEIDAHAKRYSKTYSSKYDATRAASTWTTSFDAMARKTISKKILSGDAPLSITMMNYAIKYDQKVFDGTSENGEYLDNPLNDIDDQTETGEATMEKTKNARKRVADMEARKRRANDNSDIQPNLEFDDMPSEVPEV